MQGLRSVKQISAHPTLKSLVLSFNELQGLEEFHHMDSLEELDISFNGLKSLEGLRSLTNLKTLDIRFFVYKNFLYFNIALVYNVFNKSTAELVTCHAPSKQQLKLNLYLSVGTY